MVMCLHTWKITTAYKIGTQLQIWYLLAIVFLALTAGAPGSTQYVLLLQYPNVF